MKDRKGRAVMRRVALRILIPQGTRVSAFEKQMLKEQIFWG